MWSVSNLLSAKSVILTVIGSRRLEMSETMTRGQNAGVLPKLCGADIELGNFIVGVERAGGTGYEASRALLAEIKGQPNCPGGYLYNWWSACSTSPRTPDAPGNVACTPPRTWTYNPQDIARRFSPG